MHIWIHASEKKLLAIFYISFVYLVNIAIQNYNAAILTEICNRWEIVMMSTIAGEGTNSEGREVTTTVHESGKTDAGMNGMKGM